MMSPPARHILVAGGGIAGLVSALAFAQKGFSVQIFERADRFEAAGAGIQLSPNATKILDRLGVLDEPCLAAFAPEAVVLKDARKLREISHVPLGVFAEHRWRAPYLVTHRADLQAALLARVAREAAIRLTTGATVGAAEFHPHGVTISVDIGGNTINASSRLAIGADGVRSALRQHAGGSSRSRFSGDVAWRSTLPASSIAGQALLAIARPDAVTAFMHPSMHLIAYPLNGGETLNLVAVTRGEQDTGEGWPEAGSTHLPDRALRRIAPELQRCLGDAGPWTGWPIHTVDPRGCWTDARGLALVGDAAHAMTPFAAQGAAMAIEDAATLADLVSNYSDDLPSALAAYETARRTRVRKTAQRGAFNRFAWHAAGPIAIARDLVLKNRSPDRLAADLDWLYGWEAPEHA